MLNRSLRKLLGSLISAAFFPVLAVPPSNADVKLHGLFTDNMVLQREMSVPVWGWADPGEKIAVTFDEHTYETITDENGRWILRLEPLTADGRARAMTVTGKNTVTLQNIVVGEVWIASGQSNMDMEMIPSRVHNRRRKGVTNYKQEVSQANYPFIRIYDMDPLIGYSPLEDCYGKWQVCSPHTITQFSAAAYYFGRAIHTDLGVPIGLIKGSSGLVQIVTWMSAKTLAGTGYGKMIEQWKQKVATYDHKRAKARYGNQLDAYRKARAEGREKSKPVKPIHPKNNANGPAYLYNGMIAPLIPYAIRGVIWYQGESDVHNAYAYRTLFPALICNWREDWGQGNFPFLFVQLANYAPPDTIIKRGSWPELREAQLLTLKVPNTAMVVTIDIGEAEDIHPRNKQEVGRRLALAARALAYGEKIVYSGPFYRSMACQGDRIRLFFDHLGSGLTADNPDRLQEFVISGKNRRFIKALAKIEDNTVVVWSDQISEPVAVRYAWRSNPEKAKLQNKEGLPASPFRTDDWPGTNEGN